MAKCDECVRLQNEIDSAPVAEKKVSAIKQKKDHVDKAQAERAVLMNNIRRAKEHPNEISVLLIDAMDQAKTNLPKIRLEDKAKAVDDEADHLKTRIIGALYFGVEDHLDYILYLVFGDEIHGNANLTAHIIYDVLGKNKAWYSWLICMMMISSEVVDYYQSMNMGHIVHYLTSWFCSWTNTCKENKKQHGCFSLCISY
jgi:hypothetical protein